MSYAVMRVIALFDLPTGSMQERKAASQFRCFLKRDGFDMLQYSVYSRLCINRDQAEKHLRRVELNAPKKGSVRVLYVTEHQFTNMRIVVGQKIPNEEWLTGSQLTFF